MGRINLSEWLLFTFEEKGVGQGKNEICLEVQCPILIFLLWKLDNWICAMTRHQADPDRQTVKSSLNDNQLCL